MNKIRLAIGIVLLLAAAMILLRKEDVNNDERQTAPDRSEPDHDVAGPAEGSTKNQTGEKPGSFTDSSLSENVDALVGVPGGWKSESEAIFPRLRKNIVSSASRAKLKTGESLVTGGYQDSNGNYEVTIITPKTRKSPDENPMIEVEVKLITLTPDFIRENGLESITIAEGNTIDHGEAWTSSDVYETLIAAEASDGGIQGIAAFGRMVMNPDTPFASVALGDYNGESYSLEFFIENSPDEGFLVDSWIEKPEANE